MAEVIVEHADGEMQVKEIPHGPHCLGCLAVVPEIMPWVSDQDASQLLSESEIVRKKVKQAVQVKEGLEEPHWGEEQVQQEKRSVSSMDLIIRGCTRDKFKKDRRNVDPDEVGVAPVKEVCDVLGEVDVYWSIVGWERRISSQLVQNHSEGCMGQRLYDEQPADTYDAVKKQRDFAWIRSLRATDEIDADVDAIVVARAEGATTSPTAHSPAAGTSMSWPAPMAVQTPQRDRTIQGLTGQRSSTPSIWKKPGAVPAFPGLSGKPATPTSPLSMLGTRLRDAKNPSPAPPSSPPQSLASGAGGVKGAAGGLVSATASPQEPAWKRSKSVDAGMFGTPSLSGAPKIVTLNHPAARTHPLLTAHQGKKSDDDAMSLALSQTSKAGSTLARKYPDADPFARVLLEFTIPKALMDPNICAAMTQVKRCLTQSEALTHDPNEYKKKFADLQAGMVSASQLHLVNMYDNALSNVYAHVDQITKKNQEKLLAVNVAHLNVRRAFEGLPPRSKGILNTAVERLKVVKSEEKWPISMKEPHFWSESFSEEELTKGVVPAAIREGFFTHLLPHLVREGQRRKSQVVSICKMLITLYSDLGAAYKEQHDPIVRDAKAVVLVFGR